MMFILTQLLVLQLPNLLTLKEKAHRSGLFCDYSIVLN